MQGAVHEAVDATLRMWEATVYDNTLTCPRHPFPPCNLRPPPTMMYDTGCSLPRTGLVKG